MAAVGGLKPWATVVVVAGTVVVVVVALDFLGSAVVGVGAVVGGLTEKLEPVTTVTVDPAVRREGWSASTTAPLIESTTDCAAASAPFTAPLYATTVSDTWPTEVVSPSLTTSNPSARSAWPVSVAWL